MNSEIEWLKQRITLLRAHLQEVKELFSREVKARQELKQQHQKQIAIIKNNPILQAQVVTQQVRQLTTLSADFSTQRRAMLARQKQEEVDQSKRIDLERAVKGH